MNYLIVGGVAGGATVAARLRRMDEHANIVLFERGKYVSYANCGLPYYIGGTIADRNKLFVQSVEGFTRRFRIDIRTEQEVVRIDREKRLVEVRRLATGELYTEPYNKLVLSVGAEPLRPPIGGHRRPAHLHAAQRARHGCHQGVSASRAAPACGGGRRRVHRS